MFTAPIGTRPQLAGTRPIGGGGRALLDLLMRRGSVAQADVPRLLNLSQSSVARLVGEFARAGLVTLSVRAASGPGNPSALVRLSPDFAFALGIAIVGDAVSMAVVDLAGGVRGYASAAMPDMAPREVVPALRRMRDALLSETAIDRARLIGAGAGFSGFFVGDPLRFSPPPLLADWADVDVAATLCDALGLPVLCDNDATAATLYECLLGAGRTCPTFAYCHLTNGFGGGLVIDGRAVRSWMGNAGDFGGVWYLLDRGYPNLDLLMTRVNAAGGRFGTVEEMIVAITRETPGVAQWLDDAVEPFAMLVSILGHTVSPQQVVIGGRVPTDIAAALAARIVPPRTPMRNDAHFPLPTVVASEATGDTVALGAALLPFIEMFF